MGSEMCIRDRVGMDGPSVNLSALRISKKLARVIFFNVLCPFSPVLGVGRCLHSRTFAGAVNEDIGIK